MVKTSRFDRIPEKRIVFQFTFKAEAQLITRDDIVNPVGLEPKYLYCQYNHGD